MSFDPQNFVVIVSGAGGAGKDSVLEILREHPERYAFSISYTDKPRRSDEEDGKNYHYISKEEFDKAIEADEFIEWEQTRGEYRYGRKKDEFNAILQSGKTPVMHIDVLGAHKFRKMGYKILSFFIIPPSKEEARNRLIKRGDNPTQVQERMDRFDFELSRKDLYDHIIINSDLKKAQNELSNFISLEKKKLAHRKLTKKSLKNFVLILAAALFLGAAGARVFYFVNSKLALSTLRIEPTADSTNPAGDIVANKDDQTPLVSVPSSAEIKKTITRTPPKQTAPKTASTTSKNSDGSQTVVVSTAGTVDSSLLGSSATTVSKPADIPFVDRTGKYADLGPILENYLNSTLKWKNEITEMKQITLEDAGDSGWSGQYLGQYKVSADGTKISEANGSIVLNTHYYESSPYFIDYLKITLSHEYGHHYTLYHKWVDWNLPVSVRFPDSYYAVRPLSKATTATDYSLGWKNCEAEIIAEDYSYLYSGYGYHGMAATYGYPSAATKSWLDKVGDPSLLNPVTNIAPTISITAPAEGAVLSSVVDFTAVAADDIAVSSVTFYVDSTQIVTDSTAPYETSLHTEGFENGAHVLKAVVSDGTLEATQTRNVTFQNDLTDTTKPTVTFLLPATSPYSWTSGDLLISVKATDNLKVSKIEIYINDTLVLTSPNEDVQATWQYTNADAGEYTVRARAYDSSGNTEDATIVINKT